MMLRDLCVSEILNVYQNDALRWSRSEPKKRNRCGLVFFTEGEIEYLFPNKSIVATRGSVMFFPPNIPYYGVVRSRRVAYCVLDFQTLSEDDMCNFGAPCISNAENFEQFYRDFSNIVSAWEQQKTDAVFRAKAFLFATLVQVMENDEKNISNPGNDEILTYIFHHYADHDISVLKLCKMFYISEASLRRKLLRLTGMTTNDYIMSLRLNRAKRELICTKKRIKQIAYECGFSSAYYFSRCFHQHTKTSPKEYRQNNLML